MSCRKRASFNPETNSTSRNCADWNPLAGVSTARNSRKSCGVIVCSTAMCSINTRSIACTRVNRCRACSGWPSNISSRIDSSSNNS